MALPLRRELDLHDVELTYTSTQLVTGYEPDDAIADWNIRIAETQLSDDGEERTHEIGAVSVAVFNLAQHVDWFDAGDARGDDLFSTCAELVFDPRTGDLNEDIADQLAEYPGQLIFFDHITLSEVYRGRGLAAAVVTAVLRHLAVHRSLVAAYPQPDGWQDAAPEDRTAALAKIEKTWAGLGFAPYKRGLWLRSLSLTTGWATTDLLGATPDDRPPGARR